MTALLTGSENITDIAYDAAGVMLCRTEDIGAVRKMLNVAVNARYPTPVYRTPTRKAQEVGISYVFFDRDPKADSVLAAAEACRSDAIARERLSAAFARVFDFS